MHTESQPYSAISIVGLVLRLSALRKISLEKFEVFIFHFDSSATKRELEMGDYVIPKLCASTWKNGHWESTSGTADESGNRERESQLVLEQKPPQEAPAYNTRGRRWLNLRVRPVDFRVWFADIRVGGRCRHVSKWSGRGLWRYWETKAWAWRERMRLERESREREGREHGIGGTDASGKERDRESCRGHGWWSFTVAYLLRRWVVGW